LVVVLDSRELASKTEEVPYSMKLRSAALYVLLTLSVCGIAVVVYLLILHGSLDQLGEANENCVYGDLGSVANGAGLLATAHDTACTYFIAHGGETAYVYVHRTGDPDEAKSLVFLFDESQTGTPVQLQLVWRDNVTLHISVPRVGEVLKQRNSIGAVKISYSIGEEEIPRGESAKLRRHILAILAAVLIFLVGVCVAAARSILKQKNKPS
jgi:hypothetical protein